MNTKPFSRSERVGGMIQKVLSDLLLTGISDPRLENATITGVKMAQDLKTAYVYFSTYLGEKKVQTQPKVFKAQEAMSSDILQASSDFDICRNSNLSTTHRLITA